MTLPEWLENWIDSLSLNREFYGNTLGRWLVAAAVFLLAALVLRLLKGLLVSRARRFAERTATDWDNAIVELLEATKLWFLLIVAAWGGSLVLTLPPGTDRVVGSIVIITLLIQGALWGNVFLTFSISRYVKRRMETDAAAVTTISAAGFVAKLVLWSVILLLALDNLGIDVTALIAGLGVGGIAVALAAQNILGDLFASLSIVLDKPFVLGDFIIVGDQLGTVEKIGLKTTRLRSLSGEQLVFSNTDLLNSVIRNYKRMQERRVVFSLGVTYETPREKLEAVPGMLKEAVEAREQVRFDRAHFKGFGDFSLNFEIVYYVLSSDYNLYMDVQQAINLDIVRRFEQEQIEFAYPTQTLFLQKAHGLNG